MRTTKVIGISTLLLGLLSFPVFSKENVKKVNADEYESITLTNLLGNIYDNPNGISSEIETENFSYSIRHGTIQTNNFNIKSFEIKEDSSGNKIIKSAGGHARIEWKGINIYSSEDDRIIVKFKAKKTLEFKTYVNTNTLYLAGTDDSEIKYYIPDASYDEKKQLQPDILIKMNDVHNIFDLEKVITVNAGQTFYWEYGFQYSGWDRNFLVGEANHGKTNYSFAWKQTTAHQDYALSTMVSDVAHNGGNFVSKQFVNYSVKHGNVGEDYIKDFEIITTSPDMLKDNNDNAIAENWQIRSKYNEGIIFLFDVKTYSNLVIEREKNGNDFLDGAYIKIYVNGELKSSKLFNNQTPELSDFYFESICKIGDRVAWEFSFAGKNDYRVLQMSSVQSEILTSLPMFKFTEILHEHSWSELDDGQEPHCDVNGWKDYSSCECGLYSEDEAGTKLIGDINALATWKITAGKGLIEAPGHSYGTTTYDWSDDNLSCTAGRKCNNCEHEETETANAVITHTKEPSCGEEGVYTYTVSFINEAFNTQIKTINIPKTDHVLLKILGVPAKCTKSGYKDYYSCISCGTYFEDEEGHNQINDLSSWKQSDGYLAPLGHEYGKPTYIWGEEDKTCIASRSCIHEGCKEIEIETVETQEIEGQRVAIFTNPAFATQYKKIGSYVGLIVGLSVGGGVVLVGGGLATFFIIRKRRKNVKI